MKCTTWPSLNDRRILVDDSTGRRTDTAARSGSPARAQRRRILLAEDDGEGRRLLRQALREEGHRVVAVRDGLALLGEVAATLLDGEGMPFDLIIAEQRLPGISGLSVLAGLRQCAWTTPFILITASPDGAVEADTHRLAGAILPKPFDRRALRAAVTDSAGLRAGNRGA
jgi:DNA-binding response OmpR family regulator